MVHELVIREATREDIASLYNLYHRLGKQDDGYFEKAFEHATIFVAELSGILCGLCLLNWQPRYSLYRRLNIPEIQDLNILHAHRRRGIGTKLIVQCEEFALAKRHEAIGISVGLGKEYGPAQILYSKLGFIPDGNGVTYDRENVRTGMSYPIDDNLSLMMVKAL